MRRGSIRQNCFWIYGLTQLRGQAGTGGADCRLPPGTYFCACVMHGHGQTYSETANAVMAGAASACDGLSSQAPKEYGGDAALLVIRFEVEEWQPPNYPDAELPDGGKRLIQPTNNSAVVGLISAIRQQKD